MIRSMFSAINGLNSHTTAMDVVGHNLANVNTVGYKKMRAYFQDMFYSKLAAATAPTATRPGKNPVQIGMGSQVAAIDTIFTQGSFETTGKATDLAIEGPGFFILKYGNQTFYTRAGNFSFEAHGLLVDPNGYRVQGYRFNEATGTWDPTLTDISINPNEQLPPRQTDILTLKANLSSSARGATYETWSIGPFKNSASQTVPSSATGTLLIQDSCAAESISTGDYIEILGNRHDGEAVSGRFYFDVSGSATINDSTTITSYTASTTVTAGSTVTAGYVIVVSASNTADANLIGRIYGPGETIESTGSVGVKLVGTFDDLRLYLQHLYGPNYDVYWKDGKIMITDKKCGPSMLSVQMRFVDGDVSGSKLQIPDINVEIEGKYADTHIVTQTIYDKTGQAHELKIHFIKVQGEDADDKGSFFDNPADDPNVRKSTWIFYTEMDGHVLEVDGATGRIDFDAKGTPRITYYYAHFGYATASGSHEYDIGAFGSLPIASSVGTANICPEDNCPNNLKLDIDGDGKITFVTSAGTTAQITLKTLNETGAELGIHVENAYHDLFTSPIKINLFDDLGNPLLTSLGGDSRTYYVEQNGYPPGDLIEISVDENGIVQATYSNGQTVARYRIALANFNNPQGLEHMGHSLFSETPASGPPLIAGAGEGGLGSIRSGALELSNVDIAEEFTKMILFQRGFQANARVITTSDEMLQDIIALKR